MVISYAYYHFILYIYAFVEKLYMLCVREHTTQLSFLSFLCRKLNHVLTNRLIKFFQDQAKKDPARYNEFYEDYGLYFREGVLTTAEQETRVSYSTNSYVTTLTGYTAKLSVVQREPL